MEGFAEVQIVVSAQMAGKVKIVVYQYAKICAVIESFVLAQKCVLVFQVILEPIVRLRFAHRSV
jgi:hypothetical protein